MRSITGGSICASCASYERIMRHNDVIRMKPKYDEFLEPHLWTNQIEDRLNTNDKNSAPLIFTMSHRQYSRHLHDLANLNKIA